jgi:cytochrome o ubiquinol oxidase subunit II
MPATPDGPRESEGPSQRLRSTSVRAARAALALAPLALAGCQVAVLDPQGVVGIAEKTILIDSLAIMLAIVVPTIAATLGFAWWFRASNTRATYLPDFEYSGRIELIVWSIPLLTVILLSGVAWIGSHELDPAKPLAADAPPLEVQVVSLDWKWLFIYPSQRVASVNRLVVPAGVPIHFSLTSGSVMNAFFVPQLGSMIYTMNGMVTRLHLRADNEGTFQGLSAHFSGDGFPDMLFDVHVIPQLAFPDWVARTARDSQAVLNAASYKNLVQQSVPRGKPTFRLEDPTFFQAIATQHLPPGPGPRITTQSAQSYLGAADVR